METADPPVDGPPVLTPAVIPALEEPSEPVLVPPPVVAVVVTRNPGAWLEDTLRALADSDYPSLAVLVLDAASEEDTTPRIAAILPRAYVRRLDENVGFAAAANEALDAVEGATFLLVCHDDVALEPPAIRLLVEEAYRSNAGIVGPKLVDASNPEVLLEVGMAIDRFGVPFSGIEAGELDQEQHDGVRDVFYVSSAALLVRADLFAELGGFDTETFPGSEDLDLCWRARLVGARILVVPDARVLHHEAAAARADDQTPEDALVLRHRLRAVLKAYSAATLVWVVPVALVMGLLESAIFIASRRGARARATLGAWVWNLRHFGELRADRSEVQRSRTVPDSELRWLMFHGSARIRNYLVDHVQAEARIASLGEASRVAADSARSRLREPLGIALAMFAVLFVFGSRGLFLGHVPAVGQFLPWPGVGDLLEAFGSAWRHQGLGAASTPPPVFAVQAALGTLLLGATGTARSLVVVAMVPLGVVGTYRLTKVVAGNRRAALAAALVYGINPIARNAIANGRLGPLVFFGLAPFVLRAILVLASSLPEDARGSARVRAFLPLVVMLGVATAFWPPAVALTIVAALAFLCARPLADDDLRVARLVRFTLLGGLGVFVLLLPWPLALLQSGSRAAAWGFGYRAELGLSSVLRFHTGPAGAGAGGWALLAAAALALAVTTGPRLAWAARAWVLALVGFALVWLPARFAPDRSIVAPEGVLVLSALGLALAIGLGVGAFRSDLHRFHFGWRQVAAVAAPVVLLFPALGFAADAADGRWQGPSTAWNQALSWMHSEQSQGGFRVLWVGDPAVLPLDATVTSDGTGYGITRDGPGGSLDLWPAPGGDAAGLAGSAVDLARSGRTNRLGHLLAPMGVRYVALPPRAGASGGATAEPTPGLARGLADQLDLSRLESDGGLALYENDAWAPTPSVLPGASLARLRPGARSPTGAALTADLRGARPVRDTTRTPAGAVLLGEAYAGAWHASGASRDLRHVEAFGWANGFALRAPASVGFRYVDQWQRDVLVLAQLALWGAVLVFWLRTPRRFAAWSVRWRSAREQARAEVAADTGPEVTP